MAVYSSQGISLNFISKRKNMRKHSFKKGFGKGFLVLDRMPNSQSSPTAELRVTANRMGTVRSTRWLETSFWTYSSSDPSAQWAGISISCSVSSILGPFNEVRPALLGTEPLLSDAFSYFTIKRLAGEYIDVRGFQQLQSMDHNAAGENELDC